MSGRAERWWRMARVAGWLPVFAGAVLVVESVWWMFPEGWMTRSLRTRMTEISGRSAPSVQVMGESVAAGAVQVPRLAARLGLPEGAVGNYAVEGTSPLFPYFALRRQLAVVGDVPERIVYAPHPASFAQPAFDRFGGRFATGTELIEVMGKTGRVQDGLFGGFCAVSKVLRYREELRDALVGFDATFFQTLVRPVESMEERDARSGRLPERLDGGVERYPAERIQPALRRPIRIDPACARMIDAFLELAASRGITVCWDVPPTPLALYRLQEENGSWERYGEFLRGLARRHANLVILSERPETIPDALFIDPWHLGPDGATWYTERLAGRLSGAR